MRTAPEYAVPEYSGRMLKQAGQGSGKRVAVWLWVMCGVLVVMIAVGGITRLTDSGLSMTQWRPVTGFLPPLSPADWQEEFTRYKKIPEYQFVNNGMSLEAFKSIYWWEWGHRFLGRFMAVVFLAGLGWLGWRGHIKRTMLPKLGLVFLLGMAQAVLGWYMVKSGLTDRVDVSPYRLSAHLGLAFIILAVMFRAGLIFKAQDANPLLSSPYNVTRMKICTAWGLTGLIFVQILLGGFVAGLDGGLSYNSWPLMDGRLIPQGLLAMEPLWRNFFENIVTVQFMHRLLAYVLLLAVVIHCGRLLLSGRRNDRFNSGLISSAGMLLAAVTGQTLLGIITLMLVVPFSLALLHQFGAVVVFIASLYHGWQLTCAEQTFSCRANVLKEPAPDLQ
ncbi:MAG: COX15/CtaA family protein [Parvularculales bacterium]